MTSLNKQALREAAENATAGQWVYLQKNTSIEYDYGSDDSHGSITYMDSGDFTQKQTDLNGAFIAAANPATVLALLDELEAAEKRIAELEARAVSVPEVRITVAESKRKNLTWRELGAYNEGADVAKETILAAIRAAGIGVKGE